MSDLRITRSKANALLFDLDVRQMGADKALLNEEVKKVLISARFAKDGDYFMLEIEAPLVTTHLKGKVRELNLISDTSFNSAITKMPIEAATDLISSMIADERKDLVRQALVTAGAEDDSFKGILKSSLTALGKRYWAMPQTI